MELNQIGSAAKDAGLQWPRCLDSFINHLNFDVQSIRVELKHMGVEV